MFEAMEHGELRTLYVIGENPAQSEADRAGRGACSRGSTSSSSRTSFLTRTAQMADVVLPALARRGASRRAR